MSLKKTKTKSVVKKKSGGSTLKPSQKSLKNWGDQKWQTKSGEPSAKTGERYLPKKAIAALSKEEYAATTAKKRKDTAKGQQFSSQPRKIAKKTRSYRNTQKA
jgi:hypothetical protein|tara:strand:+ start:342 stop:650 length:309 start_codon:yes stop_codon:yes gene_type:complete